MRRTDFFVCEKKKRKKKKQKPTLKSTQSLIYVSIKFLEIPVTFVFQTMTLPTSVYVSLYYYKLCGLADMWCQSPDCLSGYNSRHLSVDLLCIKSIGIYYMNVYRD